MSGFGRKKIVRPVIQKRRSNRSAAAASVTVWTTAACGSVTLVDLSTGGAGLTGPTPPQKGRDVQLRIGDHTLFGEVAWRNDEAFGLRFDEALDEHTLTVLGGVVSDNDAEGTHVPALAPNHPSAKESGTEE